MKNNVTLGNPTPTAAIAINKGRIKLYNKKSDTPTYYLKSGQEFQLELFNPTVNNILVKIKMDGVLISQSGLVLRPAERVFLDRFLDVPKKFKFDTYLVSNTNECKEAIKNNGNIEILFFNEQKIMCYNTTRTLVSPDISSCTSYLNHNTTTTTTSSNVSGTNIGFSNTFLPTNSLSFNGSEVLMDMSIQSSNNTNSKREITTNKLETGRVEKGENSDQKFSYVDMNFYSYSFHTIKYNILPISQKNIEPKELYKTYCSNCGAKAMPKANFCSKCGKKI